MTVYSIDLFLHIVGALLLFVLLTVEGLTLRQGTTGERFNRIFGPISALLILVPGLYLVASGAGWSGWVEAGLTTWVLIAVIGAITGISLLRGRMSLRTAVISWSARVGMAVAVVFIMTVKPDLLVSSIAVGQLMIALDATIVSIALPSAQAALGASDADRQWVVTAYTLSFGGLLLLGGRICDFAGRKRAFLIGLAGFAVASMVGGAAPSFAVLVSARALQGAFAALLAPTALSLLAVTFTQPRERATAFAVYGSIAGSGAAIGLLLGGVLTQYLTWRWCLYVNLPVAIVAAVGGWIVLPGSGARVRARFDLPGVALATAGLVALVYACTEAVSSGWSSA